VHPYPTQLVVSERTQRSSLSEKGEYQTRFEEIYHPIRHAIAYRVMAEDEAGEKYFGKTTGRRCGD
jgi:hypothetical protein